MSLVGDDYLECLSRGYGHSNKWICHDCISNYALKAYIKEKGELHSCSYCKKKRKSISLEILMQPIMEGIQFVYSRAVDELPVDKGGFVGCTYSTEEIFFETISEEIGASYDEIINDMLSIIGEETWCEANLFDDSEDEVEFNQWHKFCTLVKEKIRYVFFEASSDDSDSGSSPMDILNFIATCTKTIGLVTTINKSTKMYRCRMSKDEKYYSALSDFCPPPSERASAGRMNAQGIPVLYLTLDPTTALEETDSYERQYASIASYRVNNSFPVLDLTKLDTITVPSIFDSEGRPKISTIRFLKKFNEEISKKVSHDQIDYVPTQIVTEYFRFLNNDDSSQYQGILYNSAKNDGGKCLVLFLTREDVMNGKYGIHIIPRQTLYYRKKYEWVSDEEKAKSLYLKKLLEKCASIKLSDITKESGMSRTDVEHALKVLEKQGVLNKPISTLDAVMGRDINKKECAST